MQINYPPPTLFLIGEYYTLEIFALILSTGADPRLGKYGTRRTWKWEIDKRNWIWGGGASLNIYGSLLLFLVSAVRVFIKLILASIPKVS